MYLSFMLSGRADKPSRRLPEAAVEASKGSASSSDHLLARATGLTHHSCISPPTPLIYNTHDWLRTHKLLGVPIFYPSYLAITCSEAVVIPP
ncbi:hypothetical protein LZ554_001331 [Drepanopeziza brunnea f. sp. 'monogermtubi']|nr:hypothetical protein LZ554_001331 [Drepanopeziza brunnea f. sp. 'monogermtubi']